MIKKLRIKLIVASMISLFLVLFIIGGIAGVDNRNESWDNKILASHCYCGVEFYIFLGMILFLL